MLPVRKSLTKKSGIIGLPTCVNQDSLVYGGRGFVPGLLSEDPVWPRERLIFELHAGNDNHD
jgi:hypothetical protein